MATFFETVTAAINDIAEFGYESQERLEYWVELIRHAALTDLTPETELTAALQRVLAGTYESLIDKGGILTTNPGVAKYTIERLRPALRLELDKRLLASANLIRLNRDQAIAETLRRFQGWATSVPAGGTDVVNRKATKTNIRKALTSLPFEERRVIIDQGHKLSAAVSDIVAYDQSAIAAEWRSHWRQAGYNFRQDHKERDRVVYLVRNSWAIQQGLIKPGPGGYYEDHERPGEFVFCRCYVRWKFHLRDLPADMLTNKGRDMLMQARQATKKAA